MAITRIAVPMFFIISAYFLFRKMNHIDNDIEKMDIVKAYLKRNLILYITWFVVLFPITLVVRKYYAMGI